MSDGGQKRLQDTLGRILAALETRYQPEEVILFGVASEEIAEGSALKLLIVKDTEKGFFGRIREVVSICEYDDIEVEFLVYTPQELKDAAVVNTFVRNEILAKGRVVYRSAA